MIKLINIKFNKSYRSQDRRLKGWSLVCCPMCLSQVDRHHPLLCVLSKSKVKFNWANELWWHGSFFRFTRGKVTAKARMSEWMNDCVNCLLLCQFPFEISRRDFSWNCLLSLLIIESCSYKKDFSEFVGKQFSMTVGNSIWNNASCYENWNRVLNFKIRWSTRLVNNLFSSLRI